MFRVCELTQFGTPTCAAAPQLPSAALVGAVWTQTSDDPFFAEIDLTAMGYRSARRGADSGARRGERRRRSRHFHHSRWTLFGERSFGSMEVISAVFGQDPQGNRRGRGVSGIFLRRHRRALRADPQR